MLPLEAMMTLSNQIRFTRFIELPMSLSCRLDTAERFGSAVPMFDERSFRPEEIELALDQEILVPIAVPVDREKPCAVKDPRQVQRLCGRSKLDVPGRALVDVDRARPVDGV